MTPWCIQPEPSREECTHRFVLAAYHWLNGNEDAAKAWLRAALYWAPLSS